MSPELEKINELFKSPSQTERSLGMSLFRQVQWKRSDEKPPLPVMDKVYTVTFFLDVFLPRIEKSVVICHCASDSIVWFTVHPDWDSKHSFEIHPSNILELNEYTSPDV